MNNNGIIKKDSDSKKIFAMVIMIATLMVCTTSATYAYFAIAPVSNNTISGTAATAGLTLNVQKVSPTSTPGKLVPQKSSALASAMNSTNKCVDGNGNTVCLVYTVTVNNTSSAAVVVNGTITFAGSTGMLNLKWYKASGANSLGATLDDADNEDSSGMSASITTAQSLASNVSLTASSTTATTDSATYYVVIWIRETGSAQTDSGTFTSTITFNSSNGTGVTSTITG